MAKFYAGTMQTSKESIEKSAAQVKRCYLEDELEELGMTVEQAKLFMNCLTIDGIRYYQLIN